MEDDQDEDQAHGDLATSTPAEQGVRQNQYECRGIKPYRRGARDDRDHIDHRKRPERNCKSCQRVSAAPQQGK